MKETVTQPVNKKNGQILVPVLILLMLGALLLPPLLSLMITGTKASQIYETKMYELYAADAGIEDAIWSLIYDYPISVSAPPYTWNYSLSDVVNRPPVESVSIMIEYLPSDGLHRITSTATSYDGSTIVEAYVSGIVHIYSGDLPVYPGDTIPGDVYVDGDVELPHDAKILGNVTATGDVILNADAEIGGGICTEDGNVWLSNEGAVVKGDVYAGGYIRLNSATNISGDAHAGDYIELSEGAVIKKDAHAGGNVTLSNRAIIGGEVHSGGHVLLNGKQARIYGDVHLVDEGNISGSGSWGDGDAGDGCDQQCADYESETISCPVVEGSADIQSWEIK